ncbi:hypothetical protein SUGI_0947220 [Cryptomeria japonica]|uniref:uncharacterized protein LOC131066912 n=1 Tax=Cryptomeria japonica TaxID=3369 RepID=UPI0024148329|nr:uncharacterized protein LOC131066912 [Cryptomeria japonica]GLJ44997.1 hypothetical protein SUGI_0947220 [Cryptomeria japonica]
MNPKKLWLESTLILLFSLALLKPQINGAPQQKKSPSSSITVVGRVFCKTCSAPQSYFIPGAQVGVACSLGRKTGETDSRGMFRIGLPSDFKIDNCTVHLLGSSLQSCNVPFLNSSSRLSIKSRLNGHFVYRAAPLSFRPPFCKKPSRILSSQTNPTSSKFDFPFPPLIPPFGDLPPIPFLPPIGFPPLIPPFGDLPPIPFLPPISFPPLLPPFGDLPPIPFWPPLPDVPINPPLDPSPPPPPISSYLSSPPAPAPS